MRIPTFQELAESKKLQEPSRRILLSLDPGETTGWCVFSGWKLIGKGQLDTSDIAKGGQNLIQLFAQWNPDKLVFESYNIYANKLQEHTWSSVHTPQFIGVIKMLWSMHRPGNEPTDQTASIAKGFCTDDKLEAWGYWIEGLRHARDAIRHACYFMLFSEAKKDAAVSRNTD